MTNIDASRYAISVKKITDDGVDYYEAKVRELPDVAEYGDSVAEVYALAIDTIEVTAEVFEAEGKSFPLPLLDVDDFSGRVTLRMAKTLHRALASMAKHEEVSLNHIITYILTHFAGASQQRVVMQKKEVICPQSPARQNITYESNVVPITAGVTAEEKQYHSHA